MAPAATCLRFKESNKFIVSEVARTSSFGGGEEVESREVRATPAWRQNVVHREIGTQYIYLRVADDDDERRASWMRPPLPVLERDRAYGRGGGRARAVAVAGGLSQLAGSAFSAGENK